MSLPTTRRERYLYRKEKYTRKSQRARTWKYRWIKDALGHAKRDGVKPTFVAGPKQCPQSVSSASYNASPIVLPGVPIVYSVSHAGPMHPPHVKITSAWYMHMRSLNQHQPFPLVRYHARRMKAYRRLSSVKRTARDRQITGANWQFFRNGLFPLWDPLHRAPNDDDPDAVYPTTPGGWPDPLGYDL